MTLPNNAVATSDAVSLLLMSSGEEARDSREDISIILVVFAVVELTAANSIKF